MAAAKRADLPVRVSRQKFARQERTMKVAGKVASGKKELQNEKEQAGRKENLRFQP
jgi:hypothetical protein